MQSVLLIVYTAKCYLPLYLIICESCFLLGLENYLVSITLLKIDRTTIVRKSIKQKAGKNILFDVYIVVGCTNVHMHEMCF